MSVCIAANSINWYVGLSRCVRWAWLQPNTYTRGVRHSWNLVHAQLKSQTEIWNLSWNQKSQLEIRNHSLKSEITVWNQKSQFEIWNRCLKSEITVEIWNRSLKSEITKEISGYLEITSVYYPCTMTIIIIVCSALLSCTALNTTPQNWFQVSRPLALVVLCCFGSYSVCWTFEVIANDQNEHLAIGVYICRKIRAELNQKLLVEGKLNIWGLKRA